MLSGTLRVADGSVNNNSPWTTGRALYTFNVGHFCKLHKDYMENGEEHFGIIVVYRQRYAVGEQIKRLLRLINTRSAEAMKNDLWFL